MGRNTIGAALLVVLMAQVLLAIGISGRAADGARDKAEAKAEKLAIDTCVNTNPSRAFLQLRSRELEPSALESTFTTKATAQVFAIVDCEQAVREGRPVLLPEAVEEQYLSLFKKRRVAVVKGNRIVDTVSFDDYFAEDRRGTPAPLPPGSESNGG